MNMESIVIFVYKKSVLFFSVWGVMNSVTVRCMEIIHTVKVHSIVSIYQLSYCTFWNL